MQPADMPSIPAGDAAERSSKSPVSVAILAAVACLPIVVAAGFLTDRWGAAPGAAAVPADISVLALRGGLDGGAEGRPSLAARAGY